MIVLANPVRKKQSLQHTTPVWHANFLSIEPQIREQAAMAFRKVNTELKNELVAEVVANAFVAYSRLVKRGKEDIAFPTPLAQYAARQVRAGRRVGTKFNCKDVSARYVQRVKGFKVEQLDQRNREDGGWRECLVEDRRSGPAETAAARIDFAAWLRTIGRWKRNIAKALAGGESTGTVARMYGLTAGRISQLRKELKPSWDLFQS